MLVIKCQVSETRKQMSATVLIYLLIAKHVYNLGHHIGLINDHFSALLNARHVRQNIRDKVKHVALEKVAEHSEKVIKDNASCLFIA